MARTLLPSLVRPRLRRFLRTGPVRFGRDSLLYPRGKGAGPQCLRQRGGRWLSDTNPPGGGKSGVKTFRRKGAGLSALSGFPHSERPAPSFPSLLMRGGRDAAPSDTGKRPMGSAALPGGNIPLSRPVSRPVPRLRKRAVSRKGVLSSPKLSSPERHRQWQHSRVGFERNRQDIESGKGGRERRAFRKGKSSFSPAGLAKGIHTRRRKGVSLSALPSFPRPLYGMRRLSFGTNSPASDAAKRLSLAAAPRKEGGLRSRFAPSKGERVFRRTAVSASGTAASGGAAQFESAVPRELARIASLITSLKPILREDRTLVIG